MPGRSLPQLLVLLWTAAALADQQSARPLLGTASLEGVVIDSASGEPVPGVTVHLSLPLDESTTFGFGPSGGVVIGTTEALAGPIMTDGRGRFRFVELPAGHYELGAYGAGGTSRFGARTNPQHGRLVSLADGQRRSVELRLMRSAMLTGRVTDERGEPIAGMPVRAVSLVPVGVPDYLIAGFSDDRGIYSLSVAAGDYVVAALPFTASISNQTLARPVDGKPAVYVTTFHPRGQSRAEGALIRVAAGERRAGLDIQLRPQPAFRISGRFAAPEFKTGFEHVELVQLADGRDEQKPIGRLSRRGGQLNIAGVPAGQYRLRALIPPVMPWVTHGIPPLRTLPPDPTLWVDVPITVVDQDVVDLDVRPLEGVRFSGAVVFDGQEPPLEKLQNWPLVVERAGDSRVDLRGAYTSLKQFATIQLPPGEYFVRPMVRDGWFLKSVIAGGRDVIDGAIELSGSARDDLMITFTDRPARIAGAVTQPAGGDPFRAWVIVFPAERDRWTPGILLGRVAMILTGRSAAYDATLPPGQYHVAALDGMPAIPFDFGTLAGRAETVTLVSGSTVTRNLRLVEMK